MWAWLALALLLIWVPPAWAQNAITLNWDDQSSNEDGFKIERATAIAGPYTEIDSVGANVKTYVDADQVLVAGTLYCYRVRAFIIGGANSTYTNARCAVPGSKEELRFKVTPP